jgi:hypothetical protein
MPWRRRQTGLTPSGREIPKAFLEFYADDAVIECGCAGMKTITGKDGVRSYWVQRLNDYTASELDTFNRQIAARSSRISREKKP